MTLTCRQVWDPLSSAGGPGDPVGKEPFTATSGGCWTQTARAEREKARSLPGHLLSTFQRRVHRNPTGSLVESLSRKLAGIKKAVSVLVMGAGSQIPVF